MVVIAPPSRQQAVREALTDDPALAAEPRLAVLTPLEVKGLEHDGVLVLGPDQIVSESPGGERVLYVALTRATQRLVTLDVDGPGRWRPT